MGIFDEYESEEYESEEYKSEKDDKIRLFETQQRNVRSWQHYFKLLLIVSLFVLVVGGVLFYFSLPGVGDEVKAPQGLEDSVRAHFLDKEKRTMTGESVFYCGSFYWVKVEVEKRPDIPSMPNNMLTQYRARATQLDDGTWQITAAPVLSNENDTPCS